MSSLVRRYDNFVLRSASSIASVESAIRMLTYVLPSRTSDHQLTSEAIYATCGLVGLYHDNVIARAVAKLQHNRPPQSPHGRYTKFWCTHSIVYRNLATFITTLQSLSFLLEILARKAYGEKGRWRLVILIEAIKAFARVYLLRITGWRPLVYPHIPERILEPAALEKKLEEENVQFSDDAEESVERNGSLGANGNGTLAIANGTTSKHERRRSSVAVQTNGNDSHDSVEDKTAAAKRLTQFKNTQQVTDFLAKRALRVDELTPPQHLLLPLTRVRRVAELAYVFRPLIYALLLSRTQDKRSWRPWLIGIAIEYAALELHRLALTSAAAAPSRAANVLDLASPGSSVSGASSTSSNAVVSAALRRPTKLERSELMRRAFGMGWWVMRGAAYSTRTRSLLFERLARFAEARAGVRDSSLPSGVTLSQEEVQKRAALAAAATVQHAGILAGASHSLWGIVGGVANEYAAWYDNYFTTTSM
ncbi:hypothetical protein PYCC9005_003139 [Savitreella phatthalungensis]